MGKGDDPNCVSLQSAPMSGTDAPVYSEIESAAGPVPVYGKPDPIAVQQIQMCLGHDDAVGGALMADHHAGYSQPIGGVVAYRNHISVSGVGYDIGCGVRAVRTDLRAEDVDIPAMMDIIAKKISFGIGRPNADKVDHEVLDKIRAADFSPQRTMLDKAAAQLGTVGSGNHYVDLLVEEEGEGQGALWIAVHFGSRGFGHNTASGFLALAQGLSFEDRAKEGEMTSPPVLLDTRQELGQAYVSAMNLALDYAYAGRQTVTDKVLDILGGKQLHVVENHHNAAWQEQVAGDTAWVVRKGATPAAPGQLGFVGGSMGDLAVVVEGKESLRSQEALYSTVHGAGRQMSRTKAAGKWKKVWVCGHGNCDRVLDTPAAGTQPAKGACPKHRNATPRKIRVRGGGAIDWNSVQKQLRDQGIELRGGGADEAPGAYKRIEEVLAAHEGQIEIRQKLRPVGVAMAGADVFDPFKD